MESKKLVVKGNRQHATENQCQVVTRKPPEQVLDNLKQSKKDRERKRSRKERREARQKDRRAREQGLRGDGDLKQNPFSSLSG